MEIMIIVKKDTDLEEHSKEQQRNKEEKDMKFDICLFCFFLYDCFNFVSYMNF